MRAQRQSPGKSCSLGIIKMLEWSLCTYTKRSCSLPVVRRTCLPPSYIKGSYAVPDVIMSFYPYKYTEMLNLCVSCPSKEHSTYTTVTYCKEIVIFFSKSKQWSIFSLEVQNRYVLKYVIHTSRISQSWTCLRKPEAFFSPNGFTTALLDKCFSNCHSISLAI